MSRGTSTSARRRRWSELFAAYPDAVDNTQRIADRCQLEFTFGKYHLPEFQLPPGVDSPTYLRKLCDEGFAARYGTEHEDYRRSWTMSWT